MAKKKQSETVAEVEVEPAAPAESAPAAPVEPEGRADEAPPEPDDKQGPALQSLPRPGDIVLVKHGGQTHEARYVSHTAAVRARLKDGQDTEVLVAATDVEYE